ncbi:MAG TPA: class I SAM-dependent methyltransferase [Edaphobacter sp.]|nr:class I SAM-dependent methyltransferase [Edaphobacter sp.]
MTFADTIETSWVAFRNVLVCGNVLSARLLRRPSMVVSYASECWFLYRTYANERGLQQQNVFEVLGEGQDAPAMDVKLAPLIGKGSWFQSLASYTVDIVSLCLLCSLLKPKVVFEIGTLDGYTSLHFALNTPPETRIYTLDLPAEGAGPALKTTWVDAANIRAHQHTERYVFDGTPEANRIQCLFGDSAHFDYKPFLGAVDLFFIDGSHSYEYVRSDTLNALQCCHKGSVIAWHDFGRAGLNGVSKWLLEFSREHKVYSVPGGSLAFMVVK